MKKLRRIGKFPIKNSLHESCIDWRRFRGAGLELGVELGAHAKIILPI